MDTLPTVAEIMGIALHSEADGRSLLPMMRGEETRGQIAYGGWVKAGPVRNIIWRNYSGNNSSVNIYVKMGPDSADTLDYVQVCIKRIR
jgi:hypothetical protein